MVTPSVYGFYVQFFTLTTLTWEVSLQFFSHCFCFEWNLLTEQAFLLTACCLFQAALLNIFIKQIAIRAPVKIHW